MIFVTVGTSRVGFNSLIRQVDNLKINEDIICQIGNGKYIPKNCKWFKFESSLINYFKKARLIITHDGAGTLFELLKLGKKVIVIQNPDVISNPDLALKLSQEKYVIWCKNINDLSSSVINSKNFKYSKYQSPKCEINLNIEGFLK
ncbi:hypothetical protein J4216_03530 [Candidatus Woesearchaeota archaeon]|nr:hypothetical protein [Candidatus Woesearchaeota archaeon]